MNFQHRLSPLKIEFVRWLVIRLLSNVAKQMLEIVIAWHIFTLTHSAFALGLIGLCEAIPFLCASLWAGHLVDRHDKKPFIVASQLSGVVAALLLVTILGHPRSPVALIYLVVAMIGLNVSFESVASSAYAQMLIPRHRFPVAAAWGLFVFQMATISGPLVGGQWIHLYGSRTVVVVAAALWAATGAVSSQLRSITGAPTTDELSGLARIKEGLRFIRSEPLIIGPMALDMVAVLFGDCVALFPVFAARLGGGAVTLGLLRAAPAIGSGLLSLCQGLRPTIRSSWNTLRWAIFVFGLAMVSFALAPAVPFAMLALAVGGAADGVSVIVRQSLYQALTPDALRGRVSSVNGIFISSSNEIGGFESGVAASLIGAVPSVFFGAAMTFLSIPIVSRIFRIRGDRTAAQAT